MLNHIHIAPFSRLLKYEWNLRRIDIDPSHVKFLHDLVIVSFHGTS